MLNMRGVGNENLRYLCETKNRFLKTVMGMGVRSLTSSSLAGAYLGLVLSCQTSLSGWNVHEKTKGGKIVSSALNTPFAVHLEKIRNHLH